MARTHAFPFPLLVDQPIGGRIGKIGTDDAERFARDKPRLLEQSRPPHRRQRAGQNGRRNLCAPKNLVGHPVPNPGKSILHQHDGLDRRARVTIEERVQKLLIEFVGGDIGSSRAPPIRLGLAMMKAHSPKETRIAENKGLPPLLQDEVIVFFRTESGGLRPQLSCHSQMNPDPVPAGKFEKHLFAARARAEESDSGQVFHDLPRIAPAKNPFPRMELHRNDLLAETAVPLLSKKFHLGQFRHRAKCCSRLTLSRRRCLAPRRNGDRAPLLQRLVFGHALSMLLSSEWKK